MAKVSWRWLHYYPAAILVYNEGIRPSVQKLGQHPGILTSQLVQYKPYEKKHKEDNQS